MFNLNYYQKAAISFSIGSILLTLNTINTNNYNKLNIGGYALINLGCTYNLLDSFI
tara:strand:- start:3 stop:170 length:168 start_codon:yes stop_codon:yes gene_type:complete